jgi:hypothetical protein
MPNQSWDGWAGSKAHLWLLVPVVGGHAGVRGSVTQHSPMNTLLGIGRVEITAALAVSLTNWDFFRLVKLVAFHSVAQPTLVRKGD